MEEEKLFKFIYEDDEKTKVIKGYILKEDEFTYKIKPISTKNKPISINEQIIKPIILGKRSIIRVSQIEIQKEVQYD